MPTIGNYPDLIMRRIVALHVASAATCLDAAGVAQTWAGLVKPSNRIVRLGPDPWPTKEQKVTKQVADFPEWDIRPLRHGPTPGVAPPKTFCNGVTIIAEQWTFAMSLRFGNLLTDRATVLYNLSLQTLINAGKRLALSGVPLAGVSGWETPTGRMDERADATTGKTLGLVYEIELPVNVVIQAASLV